MAVPIDLIIDCVTLMAEEAYRHSWKLTDGKDAVIGQVFNFDGWILVADNESNSSYSYKQVRVNLAPNDPAEDLQYPGFMSIPDVDNTFWAVGRVSSTGVLMPHISPGSLSYLLYFSSNGGDGKFKPAYYYNGASQELSAGSNYYVMFDFNGIPRYSYDSGGVLMPPAKSEHDVVAGVYYDHKGSAVTNVSVSSSNLDVLRVPIDPTETYSYDDFYVTVESWIDVISPQLESELHIDDILPTDYSTFASEIEPTEEETNNSCCGCGDTYVYGQCIVSRNFIC